MFEKDNVRFIMRISTSMFFICGIIFCLITYLKGLEVAVAWIHEPLLVWFLGIVCILSGIGMIISVPRFLRSK